MPIQHVFLDLDDTLLDFHRAEATALSATLTEAGLTPTPQILAEYSRINAACWHELEEGRMTREQVMRVRFERLFDALFGPGHGRDSRAAQAGYEYHLSCGYFFMPGAKELLQQLHGRYHLYITSNGTAAIQDRRIAGAGIAGYFDRIFISQNLGANKPDPRFFDRCFAAMPPDARREQTVIVGDSLNSDIRGGLAAGIHTCYFDCRGRGIPEGGVQPELSCRTLEELPAILASIP